MFVEAAIATGWIVILIAFLFLLYVVYSAWLSDEYLFMVAFLVLDIILLYVLALSTIWFVLRMA